METIKCCAYLCDKERWGVQLNGKYYCFAHTKAAMYGFDKKPIEELPNHSSHFTAETEDDIEPCLTCSA